MKMFKTIDRHAQLVEKMGRTAGADLGDALASGRLSGEKLRGAVLRCTTCETADVCESWLAEQGDAGHEDPPSYCLNRDLLLSLRR